MRDETLRMNITYAIIRYISAIKSNSTIWGGDFNTASAFDWKLACPNTSFIPPVTQRINQYGFRDVYWDWFGHNYEGYTWPNQHYYRIVNTGDRKRIDYLFYKIPFTFVTNVSKIHTRNFTDHFGVYAKLKIPGFIYFCQPFIKLHNIINNVYYTKNMTN